MLTARKYQEGCALRAGHQRPQISPSRARIPVIYIVCERRSQIGSYLKAYQANPLSECRRERIKDVNCWIEPLGPSIIATSGLIRSLDMLLKDGENVSRRVAGLELGGKWMGEQILFRALFIYFQRIVDD